MPLFMLSLYLLNHFNNVRTSLIIGTHLLRDCKQKQQQHSVALTLPVPSLNQYLHNSDNKMPSFNLLDAVYATVRDPAEIRAWERIAHNERWLAENPRASQAMDMVAHNLRRNHNEASAAPFPGAILALAPPAVINTALAYVFAPAPAPAPAPTPTPPSNIDERSYAVREIICMTRTVPPSITAALVSLHEDRNGFLRSIPMDDPDTVTISRDCDVEVCPDCRDPWEARAWIVQVRCCERVFHAVCLADWNQSQVDQGININCPACRARWARQGHEVVTDRAEDRGEDDEAEAEAEEQLERFLVAEQEAEWRAEQEVEQEAQQREQDVEQEAEREAEQEVELDSAQEAEQEAEQVVEQETEQEAEQESQQEAEPGPESEQDAQHEQEQQAAGKERAHLEPWDFRQLIADAKRSLAAQSAGV
ncbi:uncharacterized protein AB675_1058 [Cyphellophora attinorum]|uniref:RING-type domain-containing protein n=1 Tax=Cyphellophora attinorum TaxID=1664694 RepID=A0A0N1H638_9EURO|nr:uncharacterized protein AB675_1058 [Phialophora attinorum]KPI38066.1 hypothetical protein AB675_1058 [Phialophora attinorum]